jgi:hypothetical protein
MSAFGGKADEETWNMSTRSAGSADELTERNMFTKYRFEQLISATELNRKLNRK